MENEKVMLLFPVPVFRYGSLGLDNAALLEEIIEGEDFFRNQSPGNYTSETFMLQENPKLKPLVDAILLRARHVFTHHLGYEYEDICVNTMWCNIQKPEPAAGHHFHEHSNSFFSGTYYAEIHDERSPIVFETPHRTKMIAPVVKTQNRLNTSRVMIPVETGDLLMWPSELRHGIPPYEGTHRRVTISFNIMFKGALGGPTWQHRY